MHLEDCVVLSDSAHCIACLLVACIGMDLQRPSSRVAAQHGVTW